MKSQRSLVLKSCCWFPRSGVAPVVQLIWVVTCPLWTQSTDVPYITTSTVYCFWKVETDYIIQLGRICRERNCPIRTHFNDIRHGFSHDQEAWSQFYYLLFMAATKDVFFFYLIVCYFDRKGEKCPSVSERLCLILCDLIFTLLVLSNQQFIQFKITYAKKKKKKKKGRKSS